MKKILNEAKKYIKKGELLNCIDTLINHIEILIEEDLKNCKTYKRISNNLILLSGRFRLLEQKKNRNTISENDYNIQRNKISIAILSSINELEKFITQIEIYNGKKDDLSNTSTLTTTTTDTTEIELTINGDFNSYSDLEKEELLRAIRVLLNLDNTEITIKKIRPGSIKLTIEIPSNKNEELLELISSGKLSVYNVISGREIISEFYSDDFKLISNILDNGGTILLPTDTMWGIGCNACNPDAIERISTLTKRNQSYPFYTFILLVDGIEMLKKYVRSISPKIETLIKHHLRPLTIVYDKGRNLPSNVLDVTGAVAIRIVQDNFCRQLIKFYNKPLAITSANINNDPLPANFFEINSEVIESVDYVFHHRRNDVNIQDPSVIVTLNKNGELVFLRE